jgi:hypothetical protein
MLEAHSGWEVCGEASDGRDAVRLAAEMIHTSPFSISICPN